ncbi:restriction system protein [Paenibacillus forsythiae]|uniref:Restriction system protein n=1 Tax=Paenibacillus forsythiae TaxID=365616 RepID=A0ABU3HDY8_9BACL|nr:restriction endonuclease [Paenibacillus forsythiae]MDT3429029.1 restriction system protein [Paenibacillus forsythiae]
MSFNEWLYTNNYQSFKEWKSLVVNKENVYPSLRIPYREWVEEYMDGIGKESIKDVKDLIRCLLGAVTRKQDLDAYSINQVLLQSENESLRERAEKMAGSERLIRLSEGQDAWEGITWILELLPTGPFNAVQALESYLFSQPNLPDDRIIGIGQCIDIIYAKFIYNTSSLEKIMSLKPIEFEWYIEALYESMGYDTLWTTATRDEGKDIIATAQRPDGFEQVYVECKLYKKTQLTIEKVRAFSRVIDKNEVNRGVIFCTGYVNKNLKNEDKRINIWTYDDMHTLLNAHLGSDWSERVKIIVENKRRKYRS